MKLPEIQLEYKAVNVSSKAFVAGGFIPLRYTCDGLNVNPPIDIGEIPAEAKSLALVVEDPDATGGTWLHWLVWNIPIKHHILESEASGIQGFNDFRKKSYGGPCPPAGTHRYFFKVYVLNELLDLPEGSTREALEAAMRDHIIAYGELMGVYKRVEHR